MKPHVNASPLFRAILIFFGLCLALPASAAFIERELPLDDVWNPEVPTGRWLAGVAAEPQKDRALLPSVTWWWVLEDGERIAEAELLAEREEKIARLRRKPRRLPLISNEGNETRSDGGEALYASEYALDISPPRFLHGRAVQAITLTPLRQSRGTLLALKGARLRLRTDGGAARTELRPQRPDFPLRERMLRSLGNEVLNPEALPAPIQPFAGDRAAGGGDFPTDVPNIEGAAVDMVMVTVDSFADLCQSFAAFKTQSGIATVVRTVEWIAERYPFGSDRTELVRNFIRDAYEKWSISYVLLVGDAEEIPPRYAYSEFFPDPRFNPTDMYYACLDGDWNLDHDAKWAEAADIGAGDPGDDADLMAEIAVGRLPAENAADCAVLLAKSRTYQEAQNTPYQNRFLMLAEVLSPICYPVPPCTTVFVDGASVCESIFGNHTDGDQHVIRVYETCDSFPAEDVDCLTVSAAFDSMSNGAGIVLHNGHGARQTMSVGDGSLDASVVDDLTNGDNTFLLYMINCTAAAFDYTCIAEAFLRNPGGGANAVIGSTRETFPNINMYYVMMFFELLHTDPGLRLGDIHFATMNAHEPMTLEENGYRWAHTTITLLADPSAWLHYELAGDIALDAPPSFPLDGEPLTLTVTKGGVPLPGAVVTLRKVGQDYRRETTDGIGQVSLLLNPRTVGTYSINVNARDVRPLSTVLTVTYPTSGPLLNIASIEVDDAGDGTVVGNGNGIAERNEIVRLKLDLFNGGLDGATSVSGLLSCSNPGVTLIDDTDVYGDIPVSSTVLGTDHYLAQITDTIVDDEILNFSLQIVSVEGVDADDFFLEASSPLLVIHRGEIDDVAGGNGDGVLGEGESADFSVSLSNYGRGTAQSLDAGIEATSGSSLTVNTGSFALGDLAPLTIDQGPALFNVTRTSADPPELLLLLTDILGHVDSLVLDLERPQGLPTGIDFRFTQQASRLIVEWEPPVEGDAAAYLLHRADVEEGPYSEISTHWIVTSSSFEDSNLLPFEPYWYKVQSISASGLLGPMTAPVMVTTNLALMEGWPVALGQETPSTPVVGDFSGDGSYEIIIGADLVYGFFPDGSELNDGDDDPLTNGPISDLGNRFYCSLAATDLTPSPGIELVAAAWNTGEVFLFEFTKTESGSVVANVAAGWPRVVAEGAGIWSSPALGDIDGDGDKEILVIDVGGHLHAWHHDGTEVLDGDNNPATDGVLVGSVGTWTRGTCAFADIDDDGAMEIFVPGANDWLQAYHGDGSVVAGFPFEAVPNQDDGIYCSPSIGDVDGDGEIEIVFTAENDSLYMINHDGSRCPGWPIFLVVNNSSIMASSVALADITGDGFPEIFAAGTEATDRMEVGWLDADANWMSGWPIISPNASQSSPVVGDLDGDGDMEVVLANENAQVEAWHHDGAEVAGFPLMTGDYNRATPLLMDVDQDGFLDMLLVGWDKNVYIWTFPTPYDGHTTPWYTFLHDQMRTSNTGTLDWVVGVEEEGAVPGLVRLDPNWPNPFNPKTTIRFTIGDTERVRLGVYDLRGRRVATLIDEDLPPGVYQRSWNGRDGSGRPQASGIYFARLQVGGSVESRKMTLLQ